MGYHRDSFYEIKRAFQVGGVARPGRAEARAPRPAPQPRLARDRGRHPGLRPRAPDLGAAARGQRAAAEGPPGQSGRRSGRLAAARTGDPAQATSCGWRPWPRATTLVLQRRADPTAGAAQRRLPLPSRGIEPPRRAAEPGHVLLGEPEGRGQGLRAGRRSTSSARWPSPRSTPARCRSPPATCSTTACCRSTSTRGAGRRRPHGQRARILRTPRQPSLRAAARDGRASNTAPRKSAPRAPTASSSA